MLPSIQDFRPDLRGSGLDFHERAEEESGFTA